MPSNASNRGSEPNTSASSGAVTVKWTRSVHTSYTVGGWWGVLDAIGHLLRLPQKVMRPICDRYELAVGIPREDLIAMDYDGRAPWWLRR